MMILLTMTPVFAIVIVIIVEFWGIDLNNLAAVGVGVQAVGFGAQKIDC